MWTGEGVSEWMLQLRQRWAGLTDHPPIKVLHSALLSNVARDAEIDEDVVEVGVLVGLQTAEHNETAAIVDGL